MAILQAIMFFGRKTINESIFVKKNAVIEMLSRNLNEQLRTAKGVQK